LNNGNGFQRVDLCINGTANVVYIVNYTNTYSESTQVPSTNLNALIATVYYTTSWVDMKFWYVRNYSSPEPIWTMGSEQTLSINQNMKRLFYSEQQNNIINVTVSPAENATNIYTDIFFRNESNQWQFFQEIGNNSYQRLGNGLHQANFTANFSLGQYVANTTVNLQNGVVPNSPSFTYFNITYPEFYNFINNICGGCLN